MPSTVRRLCSESRPVRGTDNSDDADPQATNGVHSRLMTEPVGAGYGHHDVYERRRTRVGQRGVPAGTPG